MLEAKELGRSLSIAIAAVMFGSTMILSAVGPAQAVTKTTQLASAPQTTLATVRYLA